MSEDQEEKTEEPTRKKLEDARKKGQTFNSKEVNHFLSIFAFTLLFVWYFPYFAQDVMKLRSIFEFSSDPNMANDVVMKAILFHTAKLLSLPLLILAIIPIISGLVQHGIITSLEPVVPKMDRISPLKGMKRIFSFKSIVEAMKFLLKICAITIACYFAVKDKIYVLVSHVGIDIDQIGFIYDALFIPCLIAILIIVVFIAGFDFLYQRHEYIQSMRMTKQEIKEEFKQTEGSPEIKDKLRKLRKERARQRMMQEVPNADIIITNPEHYAVALKYDKDKMQAPMLVAKGMDSLARKIKEIARKNKIAIIENKPLARALHDNVEVQEHIPEKYYKAVAEIISYVFNRKN